MTNSMTGFGRAEFTIGEESFTVEARSLNHRYLDIKVRTPERFFLLEPRIRAEIKKRFSRGSFSLYVGTVTAPSDSAAVNVPLVRKYIDAEMELKKEFGLEGAVDIPLVLRLREIFSSSPAEEDPEGDWNAFKAGLNSTLDKLQEMRRAEGEGLKKYILSGLELIKRTVLKIEELMPGAVERRREKLTEQIKKLVGDKVDEARLLTESAIFSERTDASEEISRLKSHISRMGEYLELDESVGRRLDFLCQEMLREANTTASKSDDLEIIQTVVEIKGELEKVREQVQNIE